MPAKEVRKERLLGIVNATEVGKGTLVVRKWDNHIFRAHPLHQSTFCCCLMEPSDRMPSLVWITNLHYVTPGELCTLYRWPTREELVGLAKDVLSRERR